MKIKCAVAFVSCLCSFNSQAFIENLTPWGRHGDPARIEMSMDTNVEILQSYIEKLESRSTDLRIEIPKNMLKVYSLLALIDAKMLLLESNLESYIERLNNQYTTLLTPEKHKELQEKTLPIGQRRKYVTHNPSLFKMLSYDAYKVALLFNQLFDNSSSFRKLSLQKDILNRKTNRIAQFSMHQTRMDYFLYLLDFFNLHGSYSSKLSNSLLSDYNCFSNYDEEKYKTSDSKTSIEGMFTYFNVILHPPHPHSGQTALSANYFSEEGELKRELRFLNESKISSRDQESLDYIEFKISQINLELALSKLNNELENSIILGQGLTGDVSQFTFSQILNDLELLLQSQEANKNNLLLATGYEQMASDCFLNDQLTGSNHFDLSVKFYNLMINDFKCSDHYTKMHFKLIFQYTDFLKYNDSYKSSSSFFLLKNFKFSRDESKYIGHLTNLMKKRSNLTFLNILSKIVEFELLSYIFNGSTFENHLEIAYKKKGMIDAGNYDPKKLCKVQLFYHYFLSYPSACLHKIASVIFLQSTTENEIKTYFNEYFKFSRFNYPYQEWHFLDSFLSSLPILSNDMDVMKRNKNFLTFAFYEFASILKNFSNGCVVQSFEFIENNGWLFFMVCSLNACVEKLPLKFESIGDFRSYLNTDLEFDVENSQQDLLLLSARFFWDAHLPSTICLTPFIDEGLDRYKYEMKAGDFLLRGKRV